MTDADAPKGTDAEAYVPPTEIGDILFELTVSFLRWCMRNVKGVSNLVVFAMIIVFVNYSQDVVQLTLQAAINANPAYDTSYELKAVGAGFTNGMRSYIDVAETAARSYVSVNASCLALITAGSAAAGFLQVVSSIQQSFGGDLYYVYMSYRIPGTSEWGDCGCQQTPQDGVVCSYIDRSGGLTRLRRGDPSQVLGSRVSNAFVTSQEYIRAIAQLKLQNQLDGGVWQKPQSYYDPGTQEQLIVLTYSYPVAFDPITSLCILAASVDVSVANLRSKIALSNSNKESILLDARFGIYLLSTRNSVFGTSRVYGAAATPSPRINTIVSTVLRVAASDAGLMQNVSFLYNGLRYESLTIMDTWVFVSRSPAANGGLMMASALQTLLVEYERVTSTTVACANMSSQSCQQVAQSGATTSTFLATTQYLQQTFGSRIAAIYSSYVLPNSNRNFGACGCEFRTVSSPSGPAVREDLATPAPADGPSQMCFYVDNAGTQFDFVGGSFTTPAGSSPFFMRKRAATIAATILGASSQGQQLGGQQQQQQQRLLGWSNPYQQEGTGVPSMTYSTAIFDPQTGVLVAGGHLELSLSFLSDFFSRYQTNGTDYFLIDVRPPVYLLGCLAADASNRLLIANKTSNATINAIIGYVLQRMEFDLSTNASMPYQDFLVNFQTVAPYFAIIELIPQGVATQLFFPVPAVQTVSDALHLIPANQTMGLFLLVCLMLLLFTVNMFLLGCSSLSEEALAPAPAPAPAAAAAAAPAAVAPAPPATASADASASTKPRELPVPVPEVAAESRPSAENAGSPSPSGPGPESCDVLQVSY